jgi:hypothetical protein
VQFARTVGSPNGQIDPEWKDSTSGAPSMPNIFTSASPAACTPGSTSCPTSYFLASNLKNPEVLEFDLQIQQAIGKDIFFSLSDLGSLGRELPNFLDVNLSPATTTETITIVDNTNSGPLSKMGLTSLQVPTFTAYGNTALLGTNAVNYSSITEMASNVNSNDNALVVEILNRSLKSIQFDANYTWAHALDFSQNAETEGETNAWYNPYGDYRVNYGNSSYDIPNRFVAYALYNFPNLHTNTAIKYLTNDWSLDDSFQMQNGLPFTAGVSEFTSQGIGNYLNGSSGSTVIPEIGVNTYRYPRNIVDDMRLQKSIAFEHDYQLQLLANVFNLANHQNIDAIGTTAYELSGDEMIYEGQGTANAPYDTFLVPTSSNNSGFLYTPREIEISARFIW